MSKRLNRLLIVDRAEDASRHFSRVGRRLGYTTETALELADFTRALAKFSPTVVLLDLQSIDNGGLDHLKALRDQRSDAHIIMTGDNGGRALETARQLAEFLGLEVVASPRTSIFTDVLRNELRKSRQSQTGLTLQDLEAALKNGDIRPWYQAKATYRAGQGWPITEVEALPRWHIGKSEVVLPEDFVWLAEDGGLTPAITNSLLLQAIEQLAVWQSRKIDLGVAVNLPAASLANRALPDTLSGMMRAAKLDQALLTLEISEANAMHYSTPAVETLTRLKTMGFRLAIDEFGTSYSSLEQLYRLRFDELKIDHALVLESRISSEARTIIEATVALAQKLGMSVCAEGVDSKLTLQYLGRIGCDMAQGNHISRPLRASLLENRLNEWNVPAEAC